MIFSDFYFLGIKWTRDWAEPPPRNWGCPADQARLGELYSMDTQFCD